MGFFNWLKKSSNKDDEQPAKVEKAIISSTITPDTSFPKSNKIFSNIKSPMFEANDTIQLQIEGNISWDNIFIAGKNTEKLPGFDLRSKRKVKLHYYDPHYFIIESNNELCIIEPNNIRKISLKHNLIEDMRVVEAKKGYVILSHENLIGHLDFNTCLVNLFQFNWHPFRIECGDEFWLVSTRETTEGPGELYCFSLNAELLWGLRFEEEFQTLFGTIKATGYHLRISEDNKQILVSTMDRVYRLDHKGKLISRIALAELREAEIRLEETKRRSNLPKNPRNKEEVIQVIAANMSEQFIAGTTRNATLNSPFVGFALDPQTKNVYILESQGRLTSWDPEGNLLWLYSFNEEGYFINMVDGSIVVSFRSGNTIWLDEKGVTLLSAKLPKQARAVLPIPEQEKYLIVCEDGRRYELDKQTGELIQGPEGDKGMRLFSFEGRMIFYDGYLWASTIGYFWETYLPKKTAHAVSINEIMPDNSAPQAKLGKKFDKIWDIGNPEDVSVLHYAVDKKNNLIYIGRRKIELSSKEKKQELEAQKNNCYVRWNEIICYDFSQKLIWSAPFFSELTLLAVSPKGDSIFVGLWDKGLSTDPGKLVILDFKGNIKHNVITQANPIAIRFSDQCKGMLEIVQGEPYLVHCINDSKWLIEQNPQIAKEIEFSQSGLDEALIGDYKITRKDKKVYQLSHAEAICDLKLTAAIYDAIIPPKSNELITRIGNKTLRAFSNKLEMLWEIKTKVNIKSIEKGTYGFLILSKEEILFYNWNGKLCWRLGCPPNSEFNNAIWLDRHKAFLWGAGDRNYFQVSLISTEGLIIKSHLFKEFSRYSYSPRIDSLEDETCFILKVANSIECYEI